MEFFIEKDLSFTQRTTRIVVGMQKMELFQICTYTIRVLFDTIQRIVLATQKLPFTSYRYKELDLLWWQSRIDRLGVRK